MSAGADATRAHELADALESLTHPASSVPVIYARQLKEAAALLRRLAAAPAKDRTPGIPDVAEVAGVCWRCGRVLRPAYGPRCSARRRSACPPQRAPWAA